MVETLHVKNFGPIKEAEIVIKDINIFIGTTSSGKSTLAKLISIFKSRQLITWPQTEYSERSDDLTQFRKLLGNYNIDFSIDIDTVIKYQCDDHYYSVDSKTVKTNYSVDIKHGVLNPVYVPAERVFFSTFSQSVFSLINNDISLPKWLIDFGAKFEKARDSVKSFNIPFLNVQYQLVDGTDTLKIGHDKAIKLSQGSSGLQSVVPLLLVIEYYTNPDLQSDDLFVIEEPEMNLYPSAQKDLVEFIIRRINRSKDKLIITSHSPYLLTTLDNYIQAHNTAELRQELKADIHNIVSESTWINYESISCYYFKNGLVSSTLDPEMKSIGPSNIDDVSTDLSETFEKLLSLKYSDNEL